MLPIFVRLPYAVSRCALKTLSFPPVPSPPETLTYPLNPPNDVIVEKAVEEAVTTNALPRIEPFTSSAAPGLVVPTPTFPVAARKILEVAVSAVPLAA
jgi:hypothetical protein